jgi:site-specific DNA-cytosine methylase
MQDLGDARATGFSHLLKLLQQVTVKPSYVFLENVVGFETSDSHFKLMDVLSSLGYGTKEWNLTPTQFGVPNERPRYYLFATHGAKSFPSCSTWSREFLPSALADYLDPVVEKFVPVIWDRALDQHLIARPESTTSCCFTKGK